LNDVVEPAANVYGVERPLTEKPAPVAPTWLIVALAFPLLVNVIVRVAVVPTFIFPNFSLAGVAEI
jgi:hypothetical protein